MTDFLKDRIVYRKFLSDDGKDAVYEDYTLGGVLIREIFAADSEMVQDGTAIVYFFPSVSICTDKNGTPCSLPRPKSGDLAVLQAGTEDERILRIGEAGYFTGGGSLAHIRLKLR